MKTTRILLADQSGALCEAATRLRQMMPHDSRGHCTVRSADMKEPLTQWHPDLVLMDPNHNDGEETVPEVPAKTKADGASRVLVLALSYERDPATSRRAVRRRSADDQWRITSATFQAVDIEPSVLASYSMPPWDLSTESNHAICP